MADKLLCFSLNGFPLAVEPEQIEKILINKHPTKDTFILETGVEVKSLKSYIPLPEREVSTSDNIFFVKEQKDFYGFTIDRIMGYLRLMGSEKIHPKKQRAPIKYFVKNEGRFIPVLDLQYITNNRDSIGREDIDEITSIALSFEDRTIAEEIQEVFHEVSEEDVYKSIEDELGKRKKAQHWDDLIRSEKKGLVLPLIVNIIIIIFVSFGFFYYLMVNKARVKEQIVEEKISGVEEEVIREIRRKSEAEVVAQKQKLQEAKKTLNLLQKEKEYFIQSQDKLLLERETELNRAFQESLEEARKRIAESGVANIDLEVEKEREHLYAEFLESKEKARQEAEAVKIKYEEELRLKEDSIKQEVNAYTKRINEVEQKLIEEKAKLKEAEQKAQSITLQQQEYLAFRRQLNSIYNDALGFFTRKNYSRGIEKLNTILPIIQSAKVKGIGDDMELRVEENLMKNVLYLAEREQNRINLDQVGQKTMEAAILLEKEGKLQEALSRYFTVYTVANDDNYKKTALSKAEVIMDQMFKDRTEEEKKEQERKANFLFASAMQYKSNGEYDKAIDNLEEILIDLAATSRRKKTLDEIISINKLWALKEEEEEKKKISQKAAVVLKDAKKSYNEGYYTEALNSYKNIVRNYKDSEQVPEALTEIMRISEEMRGIRTTPPPSFKEGGIESGVIVQSLPGNILLFNLGSDNNINEGDILQVYRSEDGDFAFIGTIKVFEVFPRLSKGKIVYSEEQFRIGDTVAF